jgi:hypothetical protein
MPQEQTDRYISQSFIKLLLDAGTVSAAHLPPYILNAQKNVAKEQSKLNGLLPANDAEALVGFDI